MSNLTLNLLKRMSMNTGQVLEGVDDIEDESLWCEVEKEKGKKEKNIWEGRIK